MRIIIAALIPSYKRYGVIRLTTETFRLSLPRECDSQCIIGINNSSWRIATVLSFLLVPWRVKGMPRSCLQAPLPPLISCDNFYLAARHFFSFGRAPTTVIGFTVVVRLTKISWQRRHAQKHTRALPRELIMRENNIIEGIIGCQAELQRVRLGNGMAPLLFIVSLQG